jgi:broad specificity phosphatase PhoE
MALILVRHGPTQPDPTVSAFRWPLVSGEACVALGASLPHLPVTCSDERKAIETARAIGRRYSVDPRLREVVRPWVDDPLAFEDACRRYLSGISVPEWEPQHAALARFTDAARGIVISHGTILSLYVGANTSVDPFTFWKSLQMPDAYEICGSGLTRLNVDSDAC